MSDKWTTLIFKLIEATQEDRIKWEASEPRLDLMISGLKIVGLVYTTMFLDQKFRIYRTSTQIDILPPIRNWQSRASASDAEIELEFLNKSDIVVYRAPKTQGLADLYKAAQFQAANIDNFFKKLGV